MDRGTPQVPPAPPPRPAPPPVSPTARPAELQRPQASGGPSTRDSGIPSATESRPPERVQVSIAERPLSGNGGEGSDKNPMESIEALSTVAPANPFDYSAESSTPLAPRGPRSREGHGRVSRKVSLHPGANTSEIDYIVPVHEKPHRKSCSERLAPTIKAAEEEKNKFKRRAYMMGLSVNVAIGLQVLLGALTTGIAAAVQSGRQAQVSTSILGGMSTLVASYLARTRGTGEPELSEKRTNDLEQFLRECTAFDMDHGHEYATRDLDQQIDSLRRRFEDLLGNINVEKKGSPV